MQLAAYFACCVKISGKKALDEVFLDVTFIVRCGLKHFARRHERPQAVLVSVSPQWFDTRRLLLVTYTRKNGLPLTDVSRQIVQVQLNRLRKTTTGMDSKSLACHCGYYEGLQEKWRQGDLQ